MESVIFISLLLGLLLLSLSARQTFPDERRLGLSDVPLRIRRALRKNVQGYWVRNVRVTLRDGRPAYWFTGSTPKDPNLALLVLDSGETTMLSPMMAKSLEDHSGGLPETLADSPRRTSQNRGEAKKGLAAS